MIQLHDILNYIDTHRLIFEVKLIEITLIIVLQVPMSL